MAANSNLYPDSTRVEASTSLEAVEPNRWGNLSPELTGRREKMRREISFGTFGDAIPTPNESGAQD